MARLLCKFRQTCQQCFL